MTASGTAVFTDPDDYRAGMDDASVDLVLTEPGDFSARLTWLKLGCFHAFRGRESTPRIAHMSLVPNRLFVSFPLTSSFVLVWNGVSCSSAILFFTRGVRVDINGRMERANGHSCHFPLTNLLITAGRWRSLICPTGRSVKSCDRHQAWQCDCGASIPRHVISWRQSLKYSLIKRLHERSSRSLFSLSSNVWQLPAQAKLRSYGNNTRIS